MALWRVYNRHPQGFTHKEKFKDEMLEIKAGEYKVMDYEDAVMFRGQYYPMRELPSGERDPATFKVIHLEMHDKQPNEQVITRYVCHLDGKAFDTPEALTAYLKANYSDQIFKDEALDKEIEMKRGPGRPPKEKSL